MPARRSMAAQSIFLCIPRQRVNGIAISHAPESNARGTRDADTTATRPAKLGRQISDRGVEMARSVPIDGLAITQAACAGRTRFDRLLGRFAFTPTPAGSSRSVIQCLRDEQLDKIRSKFVDAGLSLVERAGANRMRDIDCDARAVINGNAAVRNC